MWIDKNGYKRYGQGKLVHRRVAEKKLGRILSSNEVVHHKNRDKLDNKSSNLWVFRNQEEHERTHRRDKKRFGLW